MTLEVWSVLIVINLGLYTAGHMIGYHRGWQDGYWTEHPPPGLSSRENPDRRTP